MAHDASATATQKRKCPAEDETSGTLCANGCGFFGAAATANMCSKCYRDHAVAATSTAPPEKKAKMSVAVPSSDGAAFSSSPAVAVDSSVTSVKQPPAAANRCASCRKKVGLLGFRCRCEATFCSVHRYSNKHDCGFVSTHAIYCFAIGSSSEQSTGRLAAPDDELPLSSSWQYGTNRKQQGRPTAYLHATPYACCCRCCRARRCSIVSVARECSMLLSAPMQCLWCREERPMLWRA